MSSIVGLCVHLFLVNPCPVPVALTTESKATCDILGRWFKSEFSWPLFRSARYNSVAALLSRRKALNTAHVINYHYCYH